MSSNKTKASEGQRVTYFEGDVTRLKGELMHVIMNRQDSHAVIMRALVDLLVEQGRYKDD